MPAGVVDGAVVEVAEEAVETLRRRHWRQSLIIRMFRRER